ncbi:MAG: tRNA-dihydrouridine synthase, partial [Nitrospirota bacterium]
MSFWQQLSQPILGLAPMDGVTDSVFRRVVAEKGKPDVIFTEFTNVGDICRGRGAGLDSLRYSEMERPIVAQLYGKDPALFFQAAQVVGALGFDGLDINMGCPSKNVASSGSGAALIRTPELALQIIEAARRGLEAWANGQNLGESGIRPAVIETIHTANRRRGISTESVPRRVIPLSVKTRLGYDTDIIEEWSDCLIQGRPELISIHGRTLSQMYRGQSNWESIALASARIRAQGILVLGNGDIASLEDASQRIRRAGVNGVLIGRAALGNPWLFQNMVGLRETFHMGGVDEIPPSPISLEDRFQMMVEHAGLFESVHGVEKFPRMRKHLGWYCSSFPHAASLRAKMV